VEMAADVSVALLGATLCVDTESHASTAGLALVTLARHVTLAVLNRGAGSQRVGAEALSTVLSTGHAETPAFTVGNALGVGNLVVANVCQLDTSHDTISAISEAARVRPASSNR